MLEAGLTDRAPSGRRPSRGAAKRGVAATTFEALRAMPEDLDVLIAMMVVDEAHYVKNWTRCAPRRYSERPSRSGGPC